MTATEIRTQIDLVKWRRVTSFLKSHWNWLEILPWYSTYSNTKLLKEVRMIEKSTQRWSMFYYLCKIISLSKNHCACIHFLYFFDNKYLHKYKSKICDYNLLGTDIFFTLKNVSITFPHIIFYKSIFHFSYLLYSVVSLNLSSLGYMKCYYSQKHIWT